MTPFTPAPYWFTWEWLQQQIAKEHAKAGTDREALDALKAELGGGSDGK